MVLKKKMVGKWQTNQDLMFALVLKMQKFPIFNRHVGSALSLAINLARCMAPGFKNETPCDETSV